MRRSFFALLVLWFLLGTPEGHFAGKALLNVAAWDRLDDLLILAAVVWVSATIARRIHGRRRFRRCLHSFNSRQARPRGFDLTLHEIHSLPETTAVAERRRMRRPRGSS